MVFKTMKRAYKLQEFVAHASNVNCLKIGKKSRVLVTGGEDHKANMWAIGKPNAILSLSGHTSAVESVTFDSAEVLVVAGSASGTIKLWDLEEAKIVRTLTGHRSNCISLDYHPFGEIFASGSLDTNLKIWDINRKGCIHTYKGHTNGINTIKFSPDGRWVVSGGQDNVVKLWDLTAGKLMHDFKFHEGQIQCIDFHPHEFLLATGSADRTVKFWDLETFELIGSAGSETTGVRSMIFNPDGRTLLCGLHESLKVFSWEPIRCHDSVDVGWSKLADLNIHEEKLLGCSYNQSCVGVWVVDISRVGPYAATNVSKTNSLSEGKLSSSSHQLDSNLKSSVARLSLSHNLESGIREQKSTASVTAAERLSTTPPQSGMTLAVKNLPASSGPSLVSTPKKNNVSRVQPVTTFQSLGRTDVVPVIVPRNSARMETTTELKRETTNVGRMLPNMGSSKSIETMKTGINRDESDKIDPVNLPGLVSQKRTVGNEKNDKLFARTDQNISRFDTSSSNSVPIGESNSVVSGWTGAGKFRRNSSVESSDSPHGRTSMHPRLAPDDFGVYNPEQASATDLSKKVVEPGRARALAASWERRERGLTTETPVLLTRSSIPTPGLDMSSFIPRGSNRASELDSSAADDNDAIEGLMQQHNTFINILQARLTKLQVIKRFWQMNDLKGAIEAMGKMGDHSVLADVTSVLNERSSAFTLDLCTVLFPLLSQMLDSKIDRHVSVALETVLTLVKTFGHVIRATVLTSPAIGVDLEGEKRRERCNLCFVELEKIKQMLAPLTRKGGVIAKSAQELSLTLQEV